jgi:hypothetical protein
MHQPQHQEEDEPEHGHSLQGQVQQRHPPARRPGPARSSRRRGQRSRRRRTGWAPGAGAREARGRWGEEGAEGVGTEGAGRACAPPLARPRRCAGPRRARGCGRCGGRAPWSGRPLPHAPARVSNPRRPQAGPCAPPPPLPPCRRALGGASPLSCSVAAAPRTNRNLQLAPRLVGAAHPRPPEPRFPPLRGAGPLPIPAHPAARAPAASPARARPGAAAAELGVGSGTSDC